MRKLLIFLALLSFTACPGLENYDFVTEEYYAEFIIHNFDENTPSTFSPDFLNSTIINYTADYGPLVSDEYSWATFIEATHPPNRSLGSSAQIYHLHHEGYKTVYTYLYNENPSVWTEQAAIHTNLDASNVWPVQSGRLFFDDRSFDTTAQNFPDYPFKLSSGRAYVRTNFQNTSYDYEIDFYPIVYPFMKSSNENLFVEFEGMAEELYPKGYVYVNDELVATYDLLNEFYRDNYDIIRWGTVYDSVNANEGDSLRIVSKIPTTMPTYSNVTTTSFWPSLTGDSYPRVLRVESISFTEIPEIGGVFDFQISFDYPQTNFAAWYMINWDESGAEWVEFTNNLTGNFVVPAGTDSISLKYSATSDEGNILIQELMPVALPKRQPSIEIVVEGTPENDYELVKGYDSFIRINCQDAKGRNCNGQKATINFGEEQYDLVLFANLQSDENGTYVEYGNGYDYAYEHEIPMDFEGNSISVSIQVEEGGAMLGGNASGSFELQQYDYDVGVRVEVPERDNYYTGDNITINYTIYNAGIYPALINFVNLYTTGYPYEVLPITTLDPGEVIEFQRTYEILYYEELSFGISSNTETDDYYPNDYQSVSIEPIILGGELLIDVSTTGYSRDYDVGENVTFETELENIGSENLYDVKLSKYFTEELFYTAVSSNNAYEFYYEGYYTIEHNIENNESVLTISNSTHSITWNGERALVFGNLVFSDFFLSSYDENYYYHLAAAKTLDLSVSTIDVPSGYIDISSDSYVIEKPGEYEFYSIVQHSDDNNVENNADWRHIETIIPEIDIDLDVGNWNQITTQDPVSIYIYLDVDDGVMENVSASLLILEDMLEYHANSVTHGSINIGGEIVEIEFIPYGELYELPGIINIQYQGKNYTFNWEFGAYHKLTEELGFISGGNVRSPSEFELSLRFGLMEEKVDLQISLDDEDEEFIEVVGPLSGGNKLAHFQLYWDEYYEGWSNSGENFYVETIMPELYTRLISPEAVVNNTPFNLTLILTNEGYADANGVVETVSAGTTVHEGFIANESVNFTVDGEQVYVKYFGRHGPPYYLEITKNGSSQNHSIEQGLNIIDNLAIPVDYIYSSQTKWFRILNIDYLEELSPINIMIDERIEKEHTMELPGQGDYAIVYSAYHPDDEHRYSMDVDNIESGDPFADIKLTMTGPETINEGDSADFFLTIENIGQEIAENISSYLYVHASLYNHSWFFTREEYETTSLLPGEQVNYDFTLSNIFPGEYDLRFQSKYGDPNWYDNQDSIMYNVLFNGKEVQVNADVDRVIPLNDSSQVFAYLRNHGTENITNAQLRLYEDGIMIDSVIIDQVPSYFSYAFDYEPSSPGRHILKVEMPIRNDRYPANNYAILPVTVYNEGNLTVVEFNVINDVDTYYNLLTASTDIEYYYNSEGKSPYYIETYDKLFESLFYRYRGDSEFELRVDSVPAKNSMNIHLYESTEEVSGEIDFIYRHFFDKDFWMTGGSIEISDNSGLEELEGLDNSTDGLPKLYSCIDLNGTNCSEWIYPRWTYTRFRDYDYYISGESLVDTEALGLGYEDYDNDGIYDNLDEDIDGDGVLDINDTLIGDLSSINTNIEGLRLTINASENWTTSSILGVNDVLIFYKDNIPLYEYRNSQFPLILRNINLFEPEAEENTQGVSFGISNFLRTVNEAPSEVESGGGGGGSSEVIIITPEPVEDSGNSGIIYLEGLHSEVCVSGFDNDFTQQLQRCSRGTGIMECPSESDYYICEYENGNTKVTGANMIVIPKICEPDWLCTEYSICADDVQTRDCVDFNFCRDDTNRPVEVVSCAPDVPEIRDSPRRSSGGGGGGSRNGNTYTFGSGKASSNFAVSSGDTIVIEFGGRIYNFNIQSAGYSNARIEVNDQLFFVNRESSQALDLDNDNKEDISFKYQTNRNGDKQIIIQRVEIEHKAAVEVTEETIEAEIEQITDTEEEKQEVDVKIDKAMPEWLIPVGAGIVGLIIITLVVAVVAHRPKKPKVKGQENINLEPKEHDLAYEKMLAYVKSELEKGMPDDAIRQQLVDRHWDIDKIESALSEAKVQVAYDK